MTDTKVEFTDLDAPLWQGAYHFLLSWKGELYDGMLYLTAKGREILQMSVGVDREVPSEMGNEIGNYVQQEFSRQEKVHGLRHEVRKEEAAENG